MLKGHAALLDMLRDFEEAKYESWGSGVEETSQASLRQPLLLRSEEGQELLSVNFDPDLVRLLREVKYLEILGKQVPPAAIELNRSVEMFRVLNGNLQLIVNKYNEIKLTALASLDGKDVWTPAELCVHRDTFSEVIISTLGTEAREKRIEVRF